jgi:hypothetical protein
MPDISSKWVGVEKSCIGNGCGGVRPRETPVHGLAGKTFDIGYRHRFFGNVPVFFPMPKKRMPSV